MLLCRRPAIRTRLCSKLLSLRQLATTVSLVVLVQFCVYRPAAATWSIVAVDTATGEVGGASATCTPWAWAIFSIVPGTGVIVTQADSNSAARRYGARLLKEGHSPEDIISAIADPTFDPTHAIQQHGVVTLGFDAAAAGYSGDRTGSVSGDLQGRGVSVQGNILADNSVVHATLDAYERASRLPGVPLAERLMQAMEAGSAQGGDRRCGEQTAISAYLFVSKPDDLEDEPSLRVVTTEQPRGGRNAVSLLREYLEMGAAAPRRQTFIVAGHRYDGEFQRGNFDGMGTAVLKDGTRLSGEWRNNDFVVGRIEPANGVPYRFSGHLTYVFRRLAEQTIVGTGTAELPDGRRYTGSFGRSGHFHGEGLMLHPDGRRQAGRWEVGRYAGKD